MSYKLDLYAKATISSLENAEQWMKDAKLLMENSSFGHANALLRFACEETAKAYVCWLTSERMLPIDNEVVEDVFRKHRVKNEIIVSLLLFAQWISDNPKWKEMLNGDFAVSEEQMTESDKQFHVILDSTEKMRLKAMYVDINEETKEIKSPLQIDEKEAEGVLDAVQLLHKIIKTCIEETSEKDKEMWRKVFGSWLREVWETGEIPIEWLMRKSNT